MNFKHISIIALASFLISIYLLLGIGYASQPAMEAKGNMYLEVIETARTLKPDETMLVWIDINATVDVYNDYWLPADPTLYGIKWVTITFDPDIKQSNLFWTLAKI